jgi:hypothetical protein
MFSQPTNTERDTFGRRFREAVLRINSDAPGLIRGSKLSAEKAYLLVHKIVGIRQEKSLGFLPDIQQWKHLNTMLDNDRFVIAAVVGHLSPKFLALAAEEELRMRTKTLNDFTEAEFREHMQKLMNQ